MTGNLKLYDISPEAQAQKLNNVTIHSVTDSTKAFQPGDVFVAIKGRNADGHTACAEMLEKGAAAVVVERDLSLTQQIIVPNTRAYYSQLASNFYGKPTANLRLAAVTGTNGKSTVVYMLRHIINHISQKHTCGLIGTIEYDTGKALYPATYTTPQPMDLYRYFREMADNDVEFCAVEASSQALSQHRFASEDFDCGIFTNLTQDHLDWHGDMEDYFLAKRSLFDCCKRAVVYLGDDYAERLIAYLSEKGITFVTCKINGIDADYYATEITEKADGTQFCLSSKVSEKAFIVNMNMIGIFNVSNALAACAAAESMGFCLNDIAAAINCFPGVPGRAEWIYNGEITVIRDYAHTADALEKILSAVRRVAKDRRIVCVFGAAGERDEGKRFDMGVTAGKLADAIYITSDNPRFEDPERIMDMVAEGVKTVNVNYRAIADRKEAILAALSDAAREDIILLCGKGHENYQVIGNEYQPFDEREIVLEALNAERNE
jgi:UDP-N-acetylmuramoyl-L-alanyl-D-glutamate--2,6-diaminopimelate ligase